MVILVDPPSWWAHGRRWSHVVSETSLAELHAFAERAGLPSRSFEGDHYDIPQERYDDVVAAGAQAVGGRELARALRDSGLRFPKRRGERPLGRLQDPDWLPVPGRVDVLASTREPPETSTGAAEVVVLAPAAVHQAVRTLLVRNAGRDSWSPPGGSRVPGESARECAVRETAEETGLHLDPGLLVPVGYQRVQLEHDVTPPGWRPLPGSSPRHHLAVYATRLPAGPPLPDTAGDEEILSAQWLPLDVARDRLAHPVALLLDAAVEATR